MAGKEVIRKTYMGVVRSTYIIDEAGTITHVFEKVKPDTDATNSAVHSCTGIINSLRRENRVVSGGSFYCHIKVICCLHKFSCK